MKKVVTFILVMGLSMYGLCSCAMPETKSDNSSSSAVTDGISVPLSATSCLDKNYTEIVSNFEDSGFTNIQVEKDEDLIVAVLHSDGDVKSITIDGNSYFDEGDQVPSDAKIVVVYHTYPEDKKTTTTTAATTKKKTTTTEKEKTATKTEEQDDDDGTFLSLGSRNALSTANDYLAYTAFSYEGLVDQLKFEGYSDNEARDAANNCGADWNDQAVKSAQNYLDFQAFSYSGLIKQLEFEKFTSSEAEYGASHCGADWNEQAVKCAKNYLDTMSFSYSGLVNQLEFEGFTHDQAVYGVSQTGLTDDGKTDDFNFDDYDYDLDDIDLGDYGIDLGDYGF